MSISNHSTHPFSRNSHPFHIQLRHQCGICNHPFVVGDPFVTLLRVGENLSMALTNPALFIDYAESYEEKVDGLVICRHGDCQLCWRSPESTVFHRDCLETYKQLCTAADAPGRLWRVAAARVPFRWAQIALLPEDYDIPPETLKIHCASLAPRLNRLPPEILSMVWKESSQAPFWIPAAAREFASKISETKPKALVKVPVTKLFSWNRGTPPVYLTTQKCPPFIRLTIDSRGIRKLERVRREPTVNYPTIHHDVVFIFEPAESFERVEAEFKDGVLRLVVTFPTELTASIWDIATPFRPESFQETGTEGAVENTGEYTNHILRSNSLYFPIPCRMCSINLNDVTGLTFLVTACRSLVSIHGHTSDSPFASMPIDIVPCHMRPKVCWIYVPIPKGDKIIGLHAGGIDREGSRDMFSFIIRTKLAGDVYGGLWSFRAERPLLGWHPVALFSDRKENDISRILGTCCEQNPSSETLSSQTTFGSIIHRSTITRPHRPRHCSSSRQGEMEPDLNCSEAPLTGVKAVSVYHREGSKFCSGMIFEYVTGAQRAVGDCRLGVDPCKKYTQPSHIWYSQTRSTRQEHVGATTYTVAQLAHQVEFGDGSLHSGDENWECSRMSLFIRFFFEEQSGFLCVLDHDNSVRIGEGVLAPDLQ